MRKKQRQHGRVQIPAMTVLLLCFIFMGYETWALGGLKVVHGGSHESITTDKTELWENVVYDISALAQSGWEFKEEESFCIDSSGGWIKAVDNSSLKTAHLTRTPITNPATLFPAKISGKIYPTAGGDGPPPPTDWSITWKSTGDYHIDPEDKIVAYGDAPIFNYRDTSDNPVTGKWLAYRVDQAPGTFPDTGSSEFTVVTLLRGMGIYTVAATAMDESEKDMANLRVVGVKSVSAEDKTSETTTETVYVPVYFDEKITITATPDPDGEWPDDQPTWDGVEYKKGDVTVNFPLDLPSSTAQGTSITAYCGDSEKSINIVVVGIASLSYENGSCAGETICIKTGDNITLTTSPEPNVTWPSGYPKWYHDNDEYTQVAGSDSIILTGEVSSPTSDGTEISCKCATSEKSMHLVIVGVDSISTTAYGETIISKTASPGDDESICVDKSGSLSFSATAAPDGAQWPNGQQPEWYIDSNKSGVGSSFTFSAGDTIGSYVISAKCGTSQKAIKVYVVNTRYSIFAEEPSPGSLDPIKEISVTGDVFNVGHAWWKIWVTPVAAKNAFPFSKYPVIINQLVGFYGNGSIFTNSGSVPAPTPTLHIPDTTHTSTITQNYSLGIGNALSGLVYTEGLRTTPGAYILATRVFYATPYYQLDWTYASDHNCASTAVDAGIASGISGLSAYRNWLGTVAGITCVLNGDAPSFLGYKLRYP